MTRLLSQTNRYLFYLFIVFMVIPIVDVPYIGLSITAPIVFLIALDLFFGGRIKIKLNNYTWWLILSYLILFGFFGTLAFNDFYWATSDPYITTEDIIWYIRHVYWVILFIITVIIISTDDEVYLYTPLILGLSIIGLGFMRVGEGILFDTLGSRAPAIFSQNGYGILFSTFAPFALGLFFYVKRRWYPLLLIGLVVLIIAVVGNVSRGGWIGAGVGLATALVFIIFANPRWIVPSVLAIILTSTGALISSELLPEDVLIGVTERVETFQSLEDDKEWQIRLLLVQKAFTIFEESPIYGAGLGRFRDTSVDLDIPFILTYADDDYFNRKGAHNAYAVVLAETGLLGTTPYVLLIGSLCLLAIPTILEAMRHQDYEFLFAFASFVGLSVHLYAISGLSSTSPWFIYGYIVAIIQRYYFRKTALTNKPNNIKIAYSLDRLRPSS
jgi:O-antigen ligase